MCKLAKIVLLCFIALPLQLPAQQGEFGRIAQFFSSISDFDYRYPRENVYLHLDNNGYFENETLWFKAYVMRAASLMPKPLSSVLYVELLDTDGELVERKLLRIDSLGQAHGEFKLELPVRGGRFYEIRAFTREMLNWGDEAYFSRVIPIFKKGANSSAPLEILRPEVEADLNHGHPRPFDFSKKKNVRLSFYPEGGHRVKGLAGRIAYELTDGSGVPLSDTIYIYDDTGSLLATTAPLHEGLGIFLLPTDCKGAHAKVGNKRFPLPDPAPEARYALTASMDGDLHVIVSRRSDAKPELLGVAVLCRDEAMYFDTLTVGDMPVELQISRKLLGDGVNRVELIDSHGNSLARRLVWGPPTARRVTMQVSQNASSYAPFSPISLECRLTDAFGKPVETTFSLAVHEAASDVTAPPEADLATELLLCSELRGYVADPAWYFTKNEPERREALDLLLMVQGWIANRLEVMAGRDSFDLRYPVEDRLILQGRVLKNNDRGQAKTGATISLRMFNKEGYSLQSEAPTDSTGGFIFGSNVDYTGDWIAQFTTRINGKPAWSRVALDRWFAPTPRKFDVRELEIIPPPSPIPSVEEGNAAQPNETTVPTLIGGEGEGTIGTAVVRYRGYRGLRGNKYSYLGGETAGMRHASAYYNIEQLVERSKDNGLSPGLIWDVLREKDEAFDYFPDLDKDDRQYMNFLEVLGDSDAGISTTNVYMFRYAGRPALVFVDNELFLQRYKGDNPIIYADEVKSVVIMRHPSQWRLFLPTSVKAGEMEQLEPAAIFLYTRPDYTFFRTKKGIEKRTIHGYAQPAAFYNPDYHTIDTPTSADQRRTLYWNPCQHSDANGKTTAVFFSNAHQGQTLSISARGITPIGRLLYYEK